MFMAVVQDTEMTPEPMTLPATGWPPHYQAQIDAHLARFVKAAKAKRRNKFGAVACEDTLFPILRGTVFQSKVERKVAQILAVRHKAGEITDLRFHPSFKLGPAEIGYKSDFCFKEDGRWVVVEVKGVETDRWRLIQKLWAVHGPCELRIMQRGYGGAIVVTKVIPGGEKKGVDKD
jgi:hypothetical protein